MRTYVHACIWMDITVCIHVYQHMRWRNENLFMDTYAHNIYAYVHTSIHDDKEILSPQPLTSFDNFFLMKVHMAASNRMVYQLKNMDWIAH